MLKPDSEAALVELISSAIAPLNIEGGGTCGLSGDAERVSVASMSGITLYEPGALTMVAKAGTPVAEIEAALASERQRLAFEPADYRALLGTSGSPTVGGVFATNTSGPRRIQGGAARDYALGVRFVDGAGNVIKNGGRVMKNVTGYDLVKLMCGSYGTLGVLTEISFKVLPVPETSETLMVQGLGVEDAVKVMAEAMASPYEVSGAAYDPAPATGGPVTALRIEGFAASVTYRIEQLKHLFAPSGAEMGVLPAQATDTFWADIRDAQKFAERAGDVWRVSCKPSDAPKLVGLSGSQAYLMDWAGGLIWICTETGHDLRERLGQFDGHATLVRAAPETRTKLGSFHPEAPGVQRLSGGLRKRFDPHGILNPGLMGPALKVENA